MGKLIKAIVALALIAIAIALVMHYTNRSDDRQAVSAAAAPAGPSDQQKQRPKKDGPPQVQEKYGFAPVGE